LEKEEINVSSLKALNNAAGIYFHYPAPALERFVEGVIKWEDNPSILAPIVGTPKR